MSAGPTLRSSGALIDRASAASYHCAPRRRFAPGTTATVARRFCPRVVLGRLRWTNDLDTGRLAALPHRLRVGGDDVQRLLARTMGVGVVGVVGGGLHDASLRPTHLAVHHGASVGLRHDQLLLEPEHVHQEPDAGQGVLVVGAGPDPALTIGVDVDVLGRLGEVAARSRLSIIRSSIVRRRRSPTPPPDRASGRELISGGGRRTGDLAQ
jgi:hypothetical protein